jgi:hypothetical protein
MANLLQTSPREDILIANNDPLYAELWTSLAALLRSYTAVHGLHQGIEAEIEFDGHRIMARNGKRWLHLARRNKAVTWTRENGMSGVLELTDHGRLRSLEGEEDMDMAAEAWARELMQ